MMTRVVACALLVACGAVEAVPVPSDGAQVEDADMDTPGDPGQLSFTPASFAFGDVAIGSASALQVFELHSTGSSSPFVIRLSGDGADQFVIFESTCPAALPADTQCSVSISMAPTAEGAFGAQLVAESTSDGTALASLALSGAGVRSALALMPTIEGFGDITLGMSADRAFTVRNTGTASAAVPTFELGDGAFRVVSTDCASALAPNSSCGVIVRFTPTTVGVRTTNLLSRSGQAMATGQLTGTGGSTLTIARTGPGKVIGPGLDCGADCEARTSSTPVQIQAVASSGARFLGWTGAAAGCGAAATCSLPITTGALSAGAMFEDIPTLQLTVQNADPAGPPVALGRVTVSPPNDTCGGNGMASEVCTYDLIGAVVTLNAMNDCSSFVRWTGACTGTSASCTINLTADMSVTAIFDYATCQ